MRISIVRIFAGLSLVALAACGSGEAGADRMKGLKTGMGRADVLSAIGNGPMTASGNDTVRVVQGNRVMRYFMNGKNFEVFYVRDEPGDVRDLVLQAMETPIVLQDDKVVGWGWKYYGEAMKELGLPTPIIKVDSAKAPEPIPPGADSAIVPVETPPGTPTKSRTPSA